jgi:hypothetical protein
MSRTTVSRSTAHADGPVAPSWGWRIPGAGRVSHLAPGMEYQGTTVQLCGLYPYVAGSGSPMLASRSAGTCSGARSSASTRWNGCAPV